MLSVGQPGAASRAVGRAVAGRGDPEVAAMAAQRPRPVSEVRMADMWASAGQGLGRVRAQGPLVPRVVVALAALAEG